MWWNKYLFSGVAIWVVISAAHAQNLACPQTFPTSNNANTLRDVSLFIGPQQNKTDLMPDTPDETVWTLPDYQDEAKHSHTDLYLICKYHNIDKTVDLKVPQSAKECSARYDNQNQLVALCW